MTVWLVRHAEARVEPGHAIGWIDPPLSDRGAEQATSLAGAMREHRLSAVWTSDLLRARDTAAALATAHDLVASSDPNLREVSFGAWEGRRLADLWSEHPEDARAWEQDICVFPPQFGETFAEFSARVARGAAVLGEVDGDVAVVAHRGSLAMLHAHLTGGTFTQSWALPWEHAQSVAVDCP